MIVQTVSVYFCSSLDLFSRRNAPSCTLAVAPHDHAPQKNEPFSNKHTPPLLRLWTNGALMANPHSSGTDARLSWGYRFDHDY